MTTIKRFKNIILNRALKTIAIVLFIRIGTFLPVPGINHTDLAYYTQTNSVAKLLTNTFSGNDTFIIGLFFLNIFPHINASVLIQLLIGIFPKLAKLQKEGSFEGRRKISTLTRLLTLIFAIIQSTGLVLQLKQVLFNWNWLLAFEIVCWLTAGAMIVFWCSDLITEYCLGNGISILIYVNIISNLPNLTQNLFFGSEGDFQILITLIIFISLYGIIFLTQGVRNIPLISSKQLNQTTFKNSWEVDSYLPLRFNQAGVMPIILTTSILVVPNYLNNLSLLPKIGLSIDFNDLQFLYWIMHFVLIIIFSSFYAWVILNPKDLSDEFQKMSIAIPGIRPGIQTTFYLQQVMTRITTIGAIILATLTTLPNFLASQLNINSLSGLSTSSLLIVTGVLLDLRREVNNLYYATIYNEIY